MSFRRENRFAQHVCIVLRKSQAAGTWSTVLEKRYMVHPEGNVSGPGYCPGRISPCATDGEAQWIILTVFHIAMFWCLCC